METSPVRLMLAATSRKERSWDQCYASSSLIIYLELSPVIASFLPMTQRFMFKLTLSKAVQGWTALLSDGFAPVPRQKGGEGRDRTERDWTG